MLFTDNIELNTHRNNNCIWWYPGRMARLDFIPEARLGFTPWYPVALAPLHASSHNKNWFWLYTCDSCGKEHIICPGGAKRNFWCTCPGSYSKPKTQQSWPQHVVVECGYCGRAFTYHKQCASDIKLYCIGTRCRAKGQNQHWRERKNKGIGEYSPEAIAAKNAKKPTTSKVVEDKAKQAKQEQTVSTFDRVKICNRKHGNKNAQCRYYSECQDARAIGEYGARYINAVKLNKPCFMYKYDDSLIYSV